MKETLRPALLRDILIVAFGYLLAGWIGVSLVIPPGYATIIWPASGFALCATLLRGERILPGIALGSMTFNIANAMYSPGMTGFTWQAVGSACAIGLGASAQAYVGLKMARLFRNGVELTNPRRVIFGILLVVVLPCVVASTLGVISLFSAGILATDQIAQNWLTWFFGDILGVALILPILLLSAKTPAPVMWYGHVLRGAHAVVAMALATTLLVTFYTWQFILGREYRQAEEDLNEIAESSIDALQHRIQLYQRALESAASLVATKGAISPSEWRAYVDRLEIGNAYPGMRGLGLFEEVKDSDLAQFQVRLRQDYGIKSAIHPKVHRDQHFVINRIEPFDANSAALGLDLSFEEGRRDAIASSQTSAEPILTRPIVLVQDEKQGAGFLLLSPIHDDRGTPTNQWVYAPLVAEELLTGLTPRQNKDFSLEASFGGGTEHSTLLYAGEFADDPKFQLRKKVTLAGQPILLHWNSLPGFERGATSSAPLIVLLSGLLTTVLLGVLLVLMQRREGHVVREVKRATAELAESNRMLKLAEATAHIGHWHLELATNEIRWSDEVYRLHGLAIGDTPKLEQAINFYHPDDRMIVEQSLETAIATLKPYRFKARLLSVHDAIRHVEVRGRVETGEDGLAHAIIGVIIDRTDETLMREQLTASIEEARAADSAKTNFLANMSHEIRTPMNGVIGFTELALSEERVPAQKRRLRMIAESGNAMLRLLNDLLDFAKIEANQMAIVEEPTDIRHSLKSCQRLMEPVARAKGLALKLEIDPAVPPCVSIDKMRLRQIVLNLVGNALKFTDDGEVQISAQVRHCDTKASDMLHIVVRDTGIGIPDDRHAGIFAKFVQADDTTARRYGGTGLGLPISAELANLMGGELRVESSFGQGSTFTFALPLKKSAAPSRMSANVSETTEVCGHDSRLRILIAEDNPINQELTLSMVRKLGHDCHLAEDGQRVVEEVIRAQDKGAPYDLVLMDMQMPRMDGLAATRAIRAEGIQSECLPILAVTANAYADDVRRCLDAGMQGHIAKPLSLRSVSAAISDWAANAPNKKASVSASSGSKITDSIDYEEVTDPRIRAMFNDRRKLTLELIDAALKDELTEKSQRESIAGSLHQIAGAAAFFGQAELGEYCRSKQVELLNADDDLQVRDILISVRHRMSTLSEDA